MSRTHIRPVILCGGTGEGLWPLSRQSFPKQFSRVGGPDTLLQATVRRLEDCGCTAPLLMSAAAHRFIAAGQMDEIGVRGHKVVIEPETQGTGPAVCAAAELLHAEDPEALMLIVAAGHGIADVMAMNAAIASAAERAREGGLVCLGEEPGPNAAGHTALLLDTPAGGPGHVLRMRGTAPAEEVLRGAPALISTGMVLVSVKTARAIFSRRAPKTRAAVRRAIREGAQDLDFFRLGDSYKGAQPESFIAGILTSEQGWAVNAGAGWSPLETWRDVWAQTARNATGVATDGAALAQDCENTLLRASENAPRIVGLGLRNIAAIATRDAVLIADLDAAGAVPAAVAALRAEGAPEAESFAQCARPWGHYETLSLGRRFQVKSIVVKPGGQLSLQSHVHRSEHWVVVEGTARVTIGEQEQLVGENQSVYIPLGEVHRLANPGKLDLRLIEVQTGAYLGEDDIVRLEDVYARV